MSFFVPQTPLGALALLPLLVVATLTHEAGHMTVARLLRVPIRRIAIGIGPAVWRRKLGIGREFVLRAFPVSMAIGVPARTEAEGSGRRPLFYDMLMAAAGPVASLLFFVVAAALSGLLPLPPLILAFLQATAIISALLGVVNLIPFPGLDGGHLLLLGAGSIGVRLSGRQQATLHRSGLAIAAALCILTAVVYAASQL